MSTGARTGPSPEGLFFLNWKAQSHVSTVNPDWLMRWYFNFGNRENFAFHEYALPGAPASHACIRLLQRDAEWLFTWGKLRLKTTSGCRRMRSLEGTPLVRIDANEDQVTRRQLTGAEMAQSPLMINVDNVGTCGQVGETSSDPFRRPVSSRTCRRPSQASTFASGGSTTGSHVEHLEMAHGSVTYLGELRIVLGK